MEIRYNITHTILISIKPVFSKLIFSGEKTVEFKKIIPDKVTSLLVYESNPTRKIVGLVEVIGILHAPVEEMWILYRDKGCVDKQWYDDYFRKAKEGWGYGLLLGNHYRFKKEYSLDEIGVLRSPQNFMYLTPKMINKCIISKFIDGDK